MAARRTNDEALITQANLVEYFHDSVGNALSNQNVEAEPETIYYIVNLLDFYSRAERLYERTAEGLELKPLALMYAEAANESSDDARYRILRRLGDVSLFVSGVLSQSLNRRIVDLDYYIAMGGGAYGYLADRQYGASFTRSFSDIFAELAQKFRDFVDVLNEVSERVELGKQRDVLRLYETWLRTGSRRAAQLLREAGIIPRRGPSVVGTTEPG